TGTVVQMFRKKEQQIVSIDGEDLPVRMSADGVLRPMPWVSVYKYAFTLLGTAPESRRLRFDNFGRVEELHPLQPTGPDIPGSAWGRYRASWSGAQGILAQRAERPVLVLRGEFGEVEYELERLGQCVWRASSRTLLPLGGILSFESDFASFAFRTGRNKALRFR